MEFEVLYRAVESRDARFDGRVFVGVLSTGIYCRPICPVPMPKREQVRFFSTAATAEEQGFRACRRCRPEASPDSPDWDVRADLVGRGLRLIAEGIVESEGVEGLARRLAVGSRHLRRSFVEELGAGPLAIARARRTRLAKQLLEQTDLSSTEVAFASGFSSVRAYNDALRRAFVRSPTEIRSHRRRDDLGGGGLSLRLAYRPPFAAAELLSFLGARAVAGVEAVEGRTYRRSVRTPDGRHAVIALTPHPSGPGRAGTGYVSLEVSADEVPQLGRIVRAARQSFDLDADPLSIDEHLGRDKALARLVAQTPGLRLPGAADPFELAVRAVIGQRISVAGARTLAGRLVERFGTALERPVGGVTHLFPSAEQLAESPPHGVGLTGARAETIHRLAQLVAVGKLDLSGGAVLADTLRTLGEIPGVGPWTCAYVAMRALRDPDSFPANDLGVRRGFEALGLPATPSAIRARAESWRPWRAYAVMHLWASSSP